MKKVGIVGLGYVGINIAFYSSKNYEVIGYDNDKEKIEYYQKGIDLTNEIGDAIKYSKIFFTNTPMKLRECDIIIICVPTPSKNGKPDLSCLIKATNEVSNNIKNGTIVVYESTVAPGTTNGICKKIFEDKGYKYNVDFYLGYSPERVNPQDKINKVNNICKIVASENLAVLHKLNEFYKKITPNIYSINSIEVAEAAKLIENTQRDVNIAFMNEMSEYLEKKGISSNLVFNAMKTKWNSLDFTPGLVGGHCIGVDPYYLIDDAENVDIDLKIVKNARIINEKVIDRIFEKAKFYSNIGILGFTYKKNCNDLRNTKVLELYNKLINNGCNVKISDCYADKFKMKKIYNIELVENLKNIDFLIIAVNHDLYYNLNREEIENMFNNKIVIFDIYSVLNKYYGMEIYTL